MRQPSNRVCRQGNLVRRPFLVGGVSIASLILATAPVLAEDTTAPSGSAPTASQDTTINMPAISVEESAPAVRGDDDKDGTIYEKTKKATVGPLGTRDIADLPYSVTVIPKKITDDMQAKSFVDAISYLPWVQGGFARPQTRGMQGSVVQNTYLDGMNIVDTTNYPIEEFDRVEVINGLTGSLYGPANPAGIFSLVFKRPTAEPQHSFTTGYGSDSTFKEALDFSDQVDKDGKISYRANLLNDQGTSYVAGSRLRRQLASLAVDVHMTPDTTAEFNGSHYEYLQAGLPGSFAVKSGVPFPAALDPSRVGYGQTYAGDHNVTDTGSVIVKHEFNADWKLTVGVLHQIADRQSSAVTNTITDQKGNYTTTIGSATASRFTITSDMAHLNGHVQGWGIGHDLVFGTSGFDWDNYNPKAGASTTIGKASLDNPLTYSPPRWYDYTNRYHSASQQQQNLTIGDTISLSRRWSVELSGSDSWIYVHNYNLAGATTSRTADNGFSYAASLMYKPTENSTAYVSYANSLQSGDTAPSGTKNAGNIMAPYESKQWEVGYKLDLGGINLTSALYQIERPYAYTQNGYYSTIGEQVNRGIELGAFGNITDDLSVFGGVTWLDPRLTKTLTSVDRNKQIVGLARFAANMLVEYQIRPVPGLAANVGVTYVGRRPVDSGDTTWVSGYTVANLGAKYKADIYGTPTTFNVTIYNITDERYWANVSNVNGGYTGTASSSPTSATLGAPRTIFASVKVDF